jgi:hypothetical protein
MIILTEKKIIGRREKVDFPDLGLYEIDAKIDSGAFTSSIHCHNIELVKQNRKKFVSFNLLDPSHPAYNEKNFVLPVHSDKKVKSSFGNVEHRYVILTRMKIFDEIFDVELSLADRSNMEVPVLLGRKALRKKFLVDVDKENLYYRQTKKQEKLKTLRKK